MLWTAFQFELFIKTNHFTTSTLPVSVILYPATCQVFFNFTTVALNSLTLKSYRNMGLSQVRQCLDSTLICKFSSVIFAALCRNAIEVYMLTLCPVNTLIFFFVLSLSFQIYIRLNFLNRSFICKQITFLFLIFWCNYFFS